MRIDVWSDLVCPWCYLGKRRLEKALAGLDPGVPVEVKFHAFQLDPTLPRGALFDQGELLVKKYGSPAAEIEALQRKLEGTAAEEGLEYRLVGGTTGNTLDAHRVVKLATIRGVEGPVVERLFRAHFTEGRSIFDAGSLAALGAEAGLEPEEVRACVEQQALGPEVEEDLRQAREMGIRGVPFFLVDRTFAVNGAQPVDLMARALQHALQATKPG
jgi:predicted DsbA family dithiol-disulfide isomerase